MLQPDVKPAALLPLLQRVACEVSLLESQDFQQELPAYIPMMTIEKLALTCPLTCFVDTYEPVNFAGAGDSLFLFPSHQLHRLPALWSSRPPALKLLVSAGRCPTMATCLPLDFPRRGGACPPASSCCWRQPERLPALLTEALQERT